MMLQLPNKKVRPPRGREAPYPIGSRRRLGRVERGSDFSAKGT